MRLPILPWVREEWTRWVQRFLTRIGLGRREARAWAMYDWANSAMVTVVVAAVFPVYFQRVAASDLEPTVATQRFAVTTSLSLLVMAVLAPFLSAVADARPFKKSMLATFLAIGVVGTAAMFFIESGDWILALVLFVVADVGASGSFIFYDALLRFVASEDEIDRVSASGYALGYLGGGVLLAVVLAVIQFPEFFGIPTGPPLSSLSTLPTRLGFVAVAVWWILFSIPLFRWVPEPAIEGQDRTADLGGVLRSAVGKLRETARELRGYPQAILMLVAFLLYNDGIGTIIRLAVIYGAEVGISSGSLIVSILVVQFVGVPFAFVFGALGAWMGAKRAILLGLAVYLGIALLAYFMQTALHFFLLAILVGTVQGGTQALSRSLFAVMTPARKATEFFALFSLSEKFGGILGPAFFALIVAWTGSSRMGILSVVAFFTAGGLLLAFVNVERGRREANRESA